MSDGINDCRIRDGEVSSIEVNGHNIKVQQFYTRLGAEWWEVRERGPFYGLEAETKEELRLRLLRRKK